MHVFLNINKEKENELTILNETSLKVVSTSSFEERLFTFTHIVNDPQELFNLDSMHQILEAKNQCFIAYGQAQSGKSTMLGFNEQEGLMHFILNHIFQKQQQPQVTISLVQLHLYAAIDMLDFQTQNFDRKIRMRNDEPYIENLNEVSVQNEEQALLIIGEALKRNGNKFHTILTLKSELQRIQIVEVAPAIRIQKPTPEIQATNNSASALLQVLFAISTQQFLPFRNSKLTMLLRNSLQPPAQIALIGSIFAKNSQETLDTLQILKGCMSKDQKLKNSATLTNSKKNNQQVTQQQAQSHPQQQNDLSNYLLKLIAKINEHTCNLLNQPCVQQIDNNIGELVNQPIQQVIQQVQQVSMQLIESINRLAKQDTLIRKKEPVSIKADSWYKAFQYLYNAYEEEIQREDELMKQKLIYIINQNEEYVVDELKNLIFPQKQQQMNVLNKTLETLRKYTNTIKYPKQSGEQFPLLQQIYQKENNKSTSILRPQKDNIKICSYSQTLMNKFKGLKPIQEDNSIEFQFEDD